MTPGYCTTCRRPATLTEVGWFHNGQTCDGGEFVAACACGGFAGGCWVCRDETAEDFARARGWHLSDEERLARAGMAAPEPSEAVRVRVQDEGSAE